MSLYLRNYVLRHPKKTNYTEVVNIGGGAVRIRLCLNTVPMKHFIDRTPEKGDINSLYAKEFMTMINAPGNRYISIANGTHFVGLEKNRLQLFEQSGSFCDTGRHSCEGRNPENLVQRNLDARLRGHDE